MSRIRFLSSIILPVLVILLVSGGVAIALGVDLPNIPAGENDVLPLPDKFLFSINSAQAPVSYFTEPVAVDVAPDGSVYVVDQQNHRLQHFAADGTFLETWGSLGGEDGQFLRPSGIAVAPDGTVYVADGGNNRIQYFNANGKLLGMWGQEGTDDGHFNSPSGLALSPDGS